MECYELNNDRGRVLTVTGPEDFVGVEWQVSIEESYASREDVYLTIGRGRTRQEAIADAVVYLEWATDRLQQPPPEGS